MTYQKTTGPLMANSHPGSYSGQDAYSDLLVTVDGGAECLCMSVETNSVLAQEQSPAIKARDYKSPPIICRKKKGEAWAIGNGQMHQIHLQPKCGALNTMHDQICVLIAITKSGD